MTRNDEFRLLLERYLEEHRGSTPLPSRVRETVLARAATTAQRRGRLGLEWPLGLHQFAALPIVAAAALFVALGLLLTIAGQPPAGAPATSPSATPTVTNVLGVFAPVRGRVVFPVGNHLEAVNPTDPSSPHVIAPGNLGLGTNAIPAGWSADGTKLAVSDELRGASYVMDSAGSLQPVPFDLLPGWSAGCCSFVATAWLSPDGTHALAFAGDGALSPGMLFVVDLADFSRSRMVTVDQFEWVGGGEENDSLLTWSPDGSRAAYVWSKDGDLGSPAIGVVDLTSGSSRELASGWALIRHLAWSPDGSQLLVVAIEQAVPPNPNLNPLMSPHPTSLYLVGVEDGRIREIASGHFVAAAWSPDAAQIAAIDFPGGSAFPDPARQVVILGADGSGRRLLAGLPYYAHFTGVVWHPIPAQ